MKVWVLISHMYDKPANFAAVSANSVTFVIVVITFASVYVLISGRFVRSNRSDGWGSSW